MDMDDRLDSFKTFVNNLDMSGLEETTNKGILQLEDNRKDIFVYDLPIDTAHYYIQLVMSIDNPHVIITYLTSSERDYDELRDFVDGIIQAAYPGRRLTPSVTLIDEGEQIELDLSNTWEYQTYYELCEFVEKVVFHYNLDPGIKMPPSMSIKSSPFAIGHVELENPAEFIRMSYLKASIMDAGFVKAFMTRNRDYASNTFDEDAEDLAERIIEVCKIHPTQSIL